MLRWLRWRLAKWDLCTGRALPWTPHVRMTRVAHRAKVEAFPPTLDGYSRLADLWDEFATCFAPPYGRFVEAAGRHYRVPVRRILDLACGTGLVTRQMAGWAESVVGLDASEAMLRRAGERTPQPNVRYVRGDFRAFDLGRTFDAVVCGGDSLNYVREPGELTDVFRRVRRHLRPGGVFVFDVIDHRLHLALAPAKTVARVGEEQFELYHFYDPESRVSESRVVFGETVEGHRRISIDDGDVRRAAGESGLDVAESFSASHFLLFGDSVARSFHVLRVPPG